ncbi:MAG: hypothetical protein NVS1B4_11900 [Gemmatimonadaceae bacterium]
MRRGLMWSLLWVGMFAFAPMSNAQKDPRPTVAVLAFNDATLAAHPPHLALLSSALAGLLGTSLADNPAVRVIDRERVKGLLTAHRRDSLQPIDREMALRLGRLLRVRHVVYGGFAWEPDSALRINVRVVNAETATIEYLEARTGSVDQLLEQVAHFSDDITRIIAVTSPARSARTLNSPMTAEKPNVAVLEAATAPPRAAGAPKVALDAVLAYARGLDAANAGDRRTGAVHFRASLSLQPDFTPATRELRRLQPASQ